MSVHALLDTLDSISSRNTEPRDALRSHDCRTPEQLAENAEQVTTIDFVPGDGEIVVCSSCGESFGTLEDIEKGRI